MSDDGNDGKNTNFKPNCSVLLQHLKSNTARQATPAVAQAVTLAEQSRWLVQETRTFLENASAQDRAFVAQRLLGGIDNSSLKRLQLWSRKIRHALHSPQAAARHEKHHPYFWKHPRPRIITRSKIPIEERDDIGSFVQEHLVKVVFLLLK